MSLLSLKNKMEFKKKINVVLIPNGVFITKIGTQISACWILRTNLRTHLKQVCGITGLPNFGEVL